MGRSRLLSSSTGANHLVVLLVILACWGFHRLRTPYTAILLDSDDKKYIDEKIFAPIEKRIYNDANETARLDHPSLVTSSMRHSNFSFDFPVCLVHIGKAAGSSLSCGLGLMYADCEGMPRDPPLPNTFYFHLKKDTCRQVGSPKAKKNTVPVSTYLVPIRNPLTRIQSWFQFEKDIIPVRRNKREENHFKWKRGMLFVECYNNFVDLVLEGLTPQWWNTTISAEQPVNMTCPERAWAAVLGVREFSYHEWYNYEYYWMALHSYHSRLFDNTNNSHDGTFRKPSLVVLRTEHLSDDWSTISKEELFRPVNQGSRKEFQSTKNSTVFSRRTATENVLGQERSSAFWRNLCHAMCPEIQVYKQILNHGSNLDTEQMKASLQELRELCPDESDSTRNCTGIPQFPQMQVPRRQYKTEVKKRLFSVA
ncbi:hypothetical protein IV203_035556 [Nitzschia inconspicua]|uniref:Sulfotransferase n=1 Tax=Nitzschia inconspicua TaxID=303405 RepID=A0A9K3LE26_9STRA|nr:hypothetical protein IV203_035556 [Nitzschia inconspicua]